MPIQRKQVASVAFWWFAFSTLAIASMAGGQNALAQTVGKPAMNCPLAQFTFEGRIEPFERHIVSTQVSGVVEDIHVRPGERVEKGQLLFSIASRTFGLAVALAAAEMHQASVDLARAGRTAERKIALSRSRAGSTAQAEEAKFDEQVAQAALAQAQAKLDRARFDLDNTKIRAQISGVVSEVSVSRGQFLEAQADVQLGEIAQIERVRIRYHVPHEARQKAMRLTKATSVSQMLRHVGLTIIEPSGVQCYHTGFAEFEGLSADAETGLLTTWGQVANPKGILVPGLSVKVVSRIGSIPTEPPISDPETDPGCEPAIPAIH